MNIPRTNSIEVFHGEANTTEARVYVELRADSSEGISLSGIVRGPFRRNSRTLPFNSELKNLGKGESLLAGAVVVDPCFWTSDEPYYYEVHVELKREGKCVETVERMLGIRAFGARGFNLFRNSKRWVLRGVRRDTIEPAELAAWHEAGAAVVLNDPEEAICHEASLQGVMIVAQLQDHREEEWIGRLRRLSQSPAVGVAILPLDLDPEIIQRERPRNLLLAQRFEPTDTDQAIVPEPWADLAVYSSSPKVIAQRTQGCKIPVLACRPDRSGSDIETARRECDELQRDLARYGDFAGYIA